MDKIKKIVLGIFALGVLTLPVFSQIVQDTEAEFNAWQDEFLKMDKIPYQNRVAEIRKILNDNEYEPDVRYTTFTLMFAKDLINREVSNTDLIKDYIDIAARYNIPVEKLRLRAKDPNFNLYFEKKIIDYKNLKDFYDNLIKNDWELGDIDKMTESEKRDARIKLSNLFDWMNKNDNYYDIDYVTKSLKIANLYFKHPDFKKDYYCPYTKPFSACFAFASNTIGIINTGKSGVENEIAYNFMEKMLKNPNTDTASLGYFVSETKFFDKEPSEKIIKAINNGEFSDVFDSGGYATLSKRESTIDSRSALVNLLRDNKDITDEMKKYIFIEGLIDYDKKLQIVEKIINTPGIKDKNVAISEAFDKIIEAYQMGEIEDFEKSFPDSFFKALESMH